MSAGARTLIVAVAVLLILPVVFTAGAIAQDDGTNATNTTSGPNTAWQNATAIETGTRLNKTTDAGTENWYQFDAGEGGNITANVTLQNDTRLVVFLYKGSESLDRGFVSSNSTTVLQAPANASGNYFFYVRNQRNTTASYSFIVTAPQPEPETTSTTVATTVTTTTTTESSTTSTTAAETTTTETTTTNTSQDTSKGTTTGSASENRSTPQRGLNNGTNDSNTTNAGSIQSPSTSTSSTGDSGSGSLLQGIILPAVAVIILLGGTGVLFLVLFRR